MAEGTMFAVHTFLMRGTLEEKRTTYITGQY